MRREPCMAAAFAAMAAAAALATAGAAPGQERTRVPELAGESVRILAYNIHHGEGMDEVLDLDRIAALIREHDPDLVTLQEVDRGTERTAGVDQATAIADLSNMTATFGAFMPYQGGEYGMAVLSRWPVLRSENIRLPDGDEPRTALAVHVQSPESGRRLVVVGIHLYRTEGERLAQAERVIEALSGESAPVILAGDFNSQPDSPVVALLARQWYLVEKGEDHLTFPSYGPEREIDYFFYRPAASFRVLQQRVLDEPVISDHRPLLLELDWQLPY